MTCLVEALDTYEKNNISDNGLGRVPKPGEQFVVSEERLNVLLGDNKHKMVFVKKVEEISKPEECKPTKNVKKKKTK